MMKMMAGITIIAGGEFPNIYHFDGLYSRDYYNGVVKFRTFQ